MVSHHDLDISRLAAIKYLEIFCRYTVSSLGCPRQFCALLFRVQFSFQFDEIETYVGLETIVQQGL
jgi:hypothetical protein